MEIFKIIFVIVAIFQCFFKIYLVHTQQKVDIECCIRQPNLHFFQKIILVIQV